MQCKLAMSALFILIVIIYAIILIREIPSLVRSRVISAPSIVRNEFTQNTNAAVSTTEDTTPMSMCAATLFFTYSIFPAPKCWEVITEQPADNPIKNPSAKKFNELVEPTAANFISPRVWPTIRVSTTLYNSCKRFPIITGIAKSKIWLNIFPCVRFRTDLELAIDMHTSLLKIIAENKL